ncbi:MAG: gamma-glutamylcyclotransferase [Chloroflexi bacterium]|nr:gamma-glutamylcyclotransferase [Chloroflexota bacterium]MDA1240506.1 gamma-glutamylcyclotransferase [Chloroflexota bacterium]
MALVERAEVTTPAGPFLYFGFGSSLDVERLHAHCPSARLVGPARLTDHRLGFTIESKRTWLGGVADIVPAPGDEVWGALWLIDAAESHTLDEHEGVFRDPPAYERVTVEVTTVAGDRVRCRSYRVAAPDLGGFLPSPMFRDTIVRGARAVGLPDAYVTRLATLPDNGRNGDVTH